MSQSTKLFAGVIVLAGLGGAIYWAKTKDDQVGKSSTTSADLPDLKAPDDVDKISVTNADKPEIVLEKKDKTWEVTKGDKLTKAVPANQGNIEQLLKNLKELKTKEVISPQTTEENKKDYDLLPNKGTHLIVYKGGDKKLDLTFGSAGQRGQMVMVDGKPGIYSVQGYQSYLYSRELKGFRDTEILKYDDQNANGLTIQKNNKDKDVLSFTKEGEKWSGTFKGKPIDKYEEEKAKDAVRAFKALSADDFGDGKNMAETGLDEPESIVTIQLKDNAGKFVLKVGKISTGTNRWAMKEGSDTIYSIPSYTADWAMAGVEKFQKNPDAGAAPAGSGLKMPPMPGMPHGLPPGIPGHGDPHGH
jgi:hypothetical protein